MSALLIVNDNDNVAVALRDLEPGEVLEVPGQGRTQVQVREAVPFGHKMALCDIRVGGPVIKYGEVVGLAVRDICAGDHVHTHNLRAQRGRGE